MSSSTPKLVAAEFLCPTYLAHETQALTKAIVSSLSKQALGTDALDSSVADLDECGSGCDEGAEILDHRDPPSGLRLFLASCVAFVFKTLDPRHRCAGTLRIRSRAEQKNRAATTALQAQRAYGISGSVSSITSWLPTQAFRPF